MDLASGWCRAVISPERNLVIVEDLSLTTKARVWQANTDPTSELTAHTLLKLHLDIMEHAAAQSAST